MTRTFSGWRHGLPYYAPVWLAGLGALAALWSLGYPWAAAPILLLALGMTLFFRDFPRTVTAAPEEVVAPADGVVVAIEDMPESPHYDGPTRHLAIFMSLFSVHVNRAPFDATVADLRYAPGRYRNARHPESTRVNESNAMRLDTPAGPMTVRQISGAVARHIVCPVQSGDRLRKGEKFGMIRFGSRVELFLPPHTEICVTLDEKVRAGTSVVARFPTEQVQS